ncbi:hypothetical protein DFS34DRAFT_159668 [Phlyctochytrium arcticum]|nr:hypothetical protein DFS34DRAFT_159668 [Phlyctochytrium arcticum]
MSSEPPPGCRNADGLYVGQGHAPLTRTIPKLKPKREVEICFCGNKFNFWRRKAHCYHCGNVKCPNCLGDVKSTLIHYGYYEPVSICTYCAPFVKMSRMNKEQLAALPTKELKKYIAAYKLHAGNLLEKSELVKLINETEMKETHDQIFCQGAPSAISSGTASGNASPLSSPAAEAGGGRTAPSAGRTYNAARPRQPNNSQPPPPPPHPPSQSPSPPTFAQNMSGMMESMAAAFGAPQTALNVPSGAYSNIPDTSYPGNYTPSPFTAYPNPTQPNQQTPVSPSIYGSHQRQHSAPISTPLSPPRVPTAHSTGHTPPPRTEHPRPLPVDVPSIKSLIQNGIEPQTLSAKTLKHILNNNKVDYGNVLEKSELVSRVKRLVENERAEMGRNTDGDDDGLCKICCDAPINCVFLECGHLVTCMDCGKTLERKTRECPICREPIARIVRTFNT